MARGHGLHPGRPGADGHRGHQLVLGGAAVSMMCPTCQRPMPVAPPRAPRADLTPTHVGRSGADTYVPWLAPWSADAPPARTQVVEFVYVDEPVDVRVEETSD